MFAVLFEVYPAPDQWDAYLANAKMLRPELEQIDGFIDNIRYRSLTRKGWILSLSNWRDEKSLVRWRTRPNHHAVQEKGRRDILNDYHLRVGQLTLDTQLPEGLELIEQRLDTTEVGEGTIASLHDCRLDKELVERSAPEDLADQLGFAADARQACVAWDIFDAVLSPGDVILLATWRNPADVAPIDASVSAARQRHVRLVRDYGMIDRREAPQYYPEIHREPR